MKISNRVKRNISIINLKRLPVLCHTVAQAFVPQQELQYM